MKLNKEFYLEKDVDRIAQNLLGKFLVTNFDGLLTSGKIVETESYAGVTDKASHAYAGRRTKRTEIMYRQGGTIYVYLIYGIYSMFNIVTNKENIPHAILIRALEPVDGIETILSRRKLDKPKYNLSAGPGLLTQALGITTKQSGLSLFDGGLIFRNGMGQLHRFNIHRRSPYRSDSRCHGEPAIEPHRRGRPCPPDV